MAAQSHDIAIYNKFNRLPAQLPEFLHSKGFASQSAATAEQLVKVVLQLKDPIILADAGNNNYTAQKICDELLTINPLFGVPLLLAGSFAEDFEKLLAHSYKLVVAVNGTNNTRILESLEYIVAAYQRSRTVSGAYEPPKPQQTGFQSNFVFAHDAFGRHETIPGFFFSEAKALGIARAYMQGDQYLSGKINLDYLKALGIFPNDKHTGDLIQRFLDRFDRWSVQHLARTVFITGQICGALRISPELNEAAIASAFLYAAGLAGKRQQLLRVNYLRAGRLEHKRDLCSRIKDSAMLVGSELQSERLTKIIGTVARIIGGEEKAGNDEASVVASVIAAADLTDRMCFASGAWDPRAVRNLLRRIKSGELSGFHPLVLCCLIKFLSEAGLAKPWKFLLPKKLRRDPDLNHRERMSREDMTPRTEIRVPLASLLPGMRLSRPLVAFDGKEILNQDLKLDEDLIWRIWQLAAVRPLNSAIIVYSPDLLNLQQNR